MKNWIFRVVMVMCLAVSAPVIAEDAQMQALKAEAEAYKTKLEATMRDFQTRLRAAGTVDEQMQIQQELVAIQKEMSTEYQALLKKLQEYMAQKYQTGSQPTD